ncbi:MAG: sugar nucleotide-binding protein [Sarcina sp.]
MKSLIINFDNPILNKLNSKLDNSLILNNQSNSKLIKKYILDNFIDTIIFSDMIFDLEKTNHDESLTYKSNYHLATLLVNLSKSENLTLIYLSSYEVYGNYKLTEYTETDNLVPINPLGISQMKTENLLVSKLTNFFILRCSWIYGTSNCAVKQIIANTNTPLMYANEKLINPTSILEISIYINKLIESKKYGIYNCASQNSCSKLEFTKFIFKLLNIKKEVLAIPKSILTKLTPSAENSALNTSLLKSTISYSKTWEDILYNYITTELI